MKFLIIIVSLLLLTVCQSRKTEMKNEGFNFFLGTYTSGESEGIYHYILNHDGSLDSIGLATKTEDPSFLTLSTDKKFLIAVNELEDGRIESFSGVGDSLKRLSQSPSGGAHPCYVTVNEKGDVLVANYTGGNVGLLKLNTDGKLSDLLDVQQHEGGSITKRQTEPHAHSCRFDSDDNTIISADLGTDELVFSINDTVQNKLLLNKQGKLKMDPGSGPRHFEFHPNGKWIYVVNELNSTVTFIEKGTDGNYVRGESVSTLPENYNDTSYCADIHISGDGKFLYVSNRGHNSITVFKVDENNGSIKQIAHTLTKGKWPRNFSLSPNESFLLVANQHTNNIVAFERDKVTGLLTFKSEIHAPSPVCILFY